MIRLLAIWLASIALTLLSLGLFVIKAMSQIQNPLDNSKNASVEVRSFQDSRLVLSTAKVPWTVLTDKTERPSVGSTSAELVIDDRTLQFWGKLAAIDSPIGLVGFAIAETPLSLDLSPYKYIEFYARSKKPNIVYTLALKDDQADRDTGELAFDREFEVGENWTKVKLPLSSFIPMFRGRPVDGLELHRDRIQSPSFRILRSKQEASAPIPLNFDLEIGSKIYVTNKDS
ncbi:CIA30 family protein [Chroococcidiopsis cubana]|nr:CIA30 family protein [Chroococcidiopsis cubana]